MSLGPFNCDFDEEDYNFPIRPMGISPGQNWTTHTINLTTLSVGDTHYIGDIFESIVIFIGEHIHLSLGNYNVILDPYSYNDSFVNNDYCVRNVIKNDQVITYDLIKTSNQSIGKSVEIEENISSNTFLSLTGNQYPRRSVNMQKNITLNSILSLTGNQQQPSKGPNRKERRLKAKNESRNKRK